MCKMCDLKEKYSEEELKAALKTINTEAETYGKEFFEKANLIRPGLMDYIFIGGAARFFNDLAAESEDPQAKIEALMLTKILQSHLAVNAKALLVIHFENLENESNPERVN